MGAKPHPPPPAPQPVAVLGRRPQIARSMRLRLALLMVTLLVSPALTGGAQLAAQGPSPYLPQGHWATPYLEHLIARGAIADPSPLSRPFVQADVVAACPLPIPHDSAAPSDAWSVPFSPHWGGRPP